MRYAVLMRITASSPVYPAKSTQLPSLPTKNQRKPNLILILADDLGLRSGFLGSPEVLTSRCSIRILDRLPVRRIRRAGRIVDDFGIAEPSIARRCSADTRRVLGR